MNDRLPCTRAAGWYCPAVLLLILLGCGQAFAEGAWTLTTGDFREQRISLQSIDADHVTVADTPGETPRQIPMADVLELARPGETPTAPGAFVLYLSHGNRATGRAASMSGETLVWDHPLLGEFPQPLGDVRAIVRQGGKMPALEQERTEDAVALQNGDTVRGIVLGMDASHLTIRSAGDELSVPWESIDAVYFVPTAGPTDALDFRITLTDGSILPASQVAVSGETVRLNPGDGPEVRIPLNALVGVEQVNGPVRWLSSLAATESVQRPYLPGAPEKPARMNQAVDGQPIRVGGRTYRHGIGVHAYSKMVFEVEPGFTTFRTRYALGPGQYANVVVRIGLDGQTVYESSDAAPGALSEVVEIPLEGTRRLTLEVDYGAGLDVQDRFAWIQPALLR